MPKLTFEEFCNQEKDLDPSHYPTRMFLRVEYWKERALKAENELHQAKNSSMVVLPT